eukprot:4474126-Prymnesium_polylepis.1
MSVCFVASAPAGASAGAGSSCLAASTSPCCRKRFSVWSIDSGCSGRASLDPPSPESSSASNSRFAQSSGSWSRNDSRASMLLRSDVRNP